MTSRPVESMKPRRLPGSDLHPGERPPEPAREIVAGRDRPASLPVDVAPLAAGGLGGGQAAAEGARVPVPRRNGQSAGAVHEAVLQRAHGDRRQALAERPGRHVVERDHDAAAPVDEPVLVVPGCRRQPLGEQADVLEVHRRPPAGPVDEPDSPGVGVVPAHRGDAIPEVADGLARLSRDHDRAVAVHQVPAIVQDDRGESFREAPGRLEAGLDAEAALRVHEAPAPVQLDGGQPFRERLRHLEPAGDGHLARDGPVPPPARLGHERKPLGFHRGSHASMISIAATGARTARRRAGAPPGRPDGSAEPTLSQTVGSEAATPP